MREVWKYELRPMQAWYELPAGAQLLHVAVQGETACLWALIDPEAPKVERFVGVYGTGHVLDVAAIDYVGTFHLPGPLVFHVFGGAER